MRSVTCFFATAELVFRESGTISPIFFAFFWQTVLLKVLCYIL